VSERNSGETVVVAGESMSHEAMLDSKREELARIADSEATRGLDPMLAAGVVKGAREGIEKHREAVRAKFGEEALAILDGLWNDADETRLAQFDFASGSKVSDLGALHSQVLEKHALLVTDADALANRKLLDRTRVDTARGVQGYRNAANSTMMLVRLFRENTALLGKKTALTEEEVDDAARVALSMLDCMDGREFGTQKLAPAERRNRCLNKMIQNYGEVRRMLTYLRWWHDDVDAIAPSLWVSRRTTGGKKRTPENEEGANLKDKEKAPPAPGDLNPFGDDGPFAV
jgi:hypothetical protein